MSRICAWIVTSSAVVGSSAISSVGLQASAIAIITRWRMPPESCADIRASTERARDAHVLEHAQRFGARRADDRALVQPDRFGDLDADREHRVEAVIGSWKIIAISAPRMSRSVAARRARGRRRAAGRVNRAAHRRCARRVLDEPHDRQRGDRFAGARFADHGDRFAAPDLEG